MKNGLDRPRRPFPRSSESLPVTTVRHSSTVRVIRGAPTPTLQAEFQRLSRPGRSIEGQPDPHLLKSSRSGQFQYDIPLRQGSHELHLYFAETEYGEGNPLGGGEASRIFDVDCEWCPHSDHVRSACERRLP